MIVRLMRLCLETGPSNGQGGDKYLKCLIYEWRSDARRRGERGELLYLSLA
jgi:hypothetical protein